MLLNSFKYFCPKVSQVVLIHDFSSEYLGWVPNAVFVNIASVYTLALLANIESLTITKP